MQNHFPFVFVDHANPASLHLHLHLYLHLYLHLHLRLHLHLHPRISASPHHCVKIPPLKFFLESLDSDHSLDPGFTLILRGFSASWGSLKMAILQIAKRDKKKNNFR